MKPDWPLIWTVASSVLASGVLSAGIAGWISRRNTKDMLKSQRELAELQGEQARTVEQLKVGLADEQMRLRSSLEALQPANVLVSRMHHAADSVLLRLEGSSDATQGGVLAVRAIELINEMGHELQGSAAVLPLRLQTLAANLPDRLTKAMADAMSAHERENYLGLRNCGSQVLESRIEWQLAVLEHFRPEEFAKEKQRAMEIARRFGEVDNKTAPS
jgi:hypothetical protein